MKTLLILRHAKSSWSNARLSDYQRPLNERGKRDAPRMGKLLLDEGLVPGLIISSSAERALATAELVALNCDYEGEIMTTRALYQGDPEDYLGVLHDAGDPHERVMVVGHNPGIAELVAWLTDERERMPTASLAQVALPLNRWLDLDGESEGELVNIWQPREL